MTQAKRILIVDDDEAYRGALKKLLTVEGMSITEASDGKAAQTLISAGAFDLVISDIRMPELDGLALLKWIKSSHRVPVVLITGFSEIIETAEAYRLGADDFLLKPFQAEDILRSIRKCLNRESTPDEGEDLDRSYCRIPLGDFVTGSRIHFNVFLRISARKYVRIAYKGEDLSMDRIRTYQLKGVLYVYVTREDFGKYVGFSLDLVRRMSHSSVISEEKKQNFLRYTGELVIEQIRIADLDEGSFQSAREFAESALDVLSESGEAIAILDALNNHADHLYAHSVAVSVYSVLIAKAMDWQASPTLFKLAIGGLMHDIGLKEIPKEILAKPRMLMSHEERLLYESHATRGMELLNQVQCAPGDAILIAYQHHEDCTGFGYPKKLPKKMIHPLARIVSVADQFVELAIKGPGSEGMPGRQAVERMLQVGAERLDTEALTALMKVFKVMPPAKGGRVA